MRVVYDYRAFTRQQYGGVSRYFAQLATHLSLLDNTTVKILAPAHINRHLRTVTPDISSGRYIERLSKPMGRILNLYNGIAFQRFVRQYEPQVYHQTYYSSPAPGKMSGCIRVVTVYDMIHERFPEYFSAIDRTVEQKLEAVRRADHVICISNSTKSDLLELTGISPAKVSVVYLGVDAPLSIGSTASPLSDPFILYVGERRGYKNFDRLLQAYASSSMLSGHVRLVCFGGGGFSTRETSAFEKLGLPQGALVSLQGDDELLARLYKHAEAMVFPSLYEGFGLPLVEAMSYGCPVVCGHESGSVGEVVGDCATLFDPRDVCSIKGAMESLLQDRELRESYALKGLSRAKSFAWIDCARNTRSAYESCR